jgi:hypothetical protein
MDDLERVGVEALSGRRHGRLDVGGDFLITHV